MQNMSLFREKPESLSRSLLSSHRNQNLMRLLDRIDLQAASHATHTNRLRVLKHTQELNLLRNWHTHQLFNDSSMISYTDVSPLPYSIDASQLLENNAKRSYISSIKKPQFHMQSKFPSPPSATLYPTNIQPQTVYHSRTPTTYAARLLPPNDISPERKSNFDENLSEINQSQAIYDRHNTENDDDDDINIRLTGHRNNKPNNSISNKYNYNNMPAHNVPPSYYQSTTTTRDKIPIEVPFLTYGGCRWVLDTPTIPLPQGVQPTPLPILKNHPPHFDLHSEMDYQYPTTESPDVANLKPQFQLQRNEQICKDQAKTNQIKYPEVFRDDYTFPNNKSLYKTPHTDLSHRKSNNTNTNTDSVHTKIAESYANKSSAALPPSPTNSPVGHYDERRHSMSLSASTVDASMKRPSHIHMTNDALRGEHTAPAIDSNDYITAVHEENKTSIFLPQRTHTENSASQEMKSTLKNTAPTNDYTQEQNIVPIDPMTSESSGEILHAANTAASDNAYIQKPLSLHFADRTDTMPIDSSTALHGNRDENVDDGLVRRDTTGESAFNSSTAPGTNGVDLTGDMSHLAHIEESVYGEKILDFSTEESHLTNSDDAVDNASHALSGNHFNDTIPENNNDLALHAEMNNSTNQSINQKYELTVSPNESNTETKQFAEENASDATSPYNYQDEFDIKGVSNFDEGLDSTNQKLYNDQQYLSPDAVDNPAQHLPDEYIYEDNANVNQNFGDPQYPPVNHYDEQQYETTAEYEDNYYAPQPSSEDHNQYYNEQLQPGEQYYANDDNVQAIASGAHSTDVNYYNDYDTAISHQPPENYLESTVGFEVQQPSNEVLGYNDSVQQGLSQPVENYLESTVGFEVQQPSNEVLGYNDSVQQGLSQPVEHYSESTVGLELQHESNEDDLGYSVQSHTDLIATEGDPVQQSLRKDGEHSESDFDFSTQSTH